MIFKDETRIFLKKFFSELYEATTFNKIEISDNMSEEKRKDAKEFNKRIDIAIQTINIYLKDYLFRQYPNVILKFENKSDNTDNEYFFAVRIDDNYIVAFDKEVLLQDYLKNMNIYLIDIESNNITFCDKKIHFNSDNVKSIKQLDKNNITEISQFIIDIFQN